MARSNRKRTPSAKRQNHFPEAFKAHVERARSNAGTPHDPRPNRRRTRQDGKRAAIRESRGE